MRKRVRNSSSRRKRGEKEKNSKKSKKSKAIIDYSVTEEEIEDGGVLDELTEENKEEQLGEGPMSYSRGVPNNNVCLNTLRFT